MTANFRLCVIRCISIALISMGFAQFATAGTIDTGYLLETGDREATLGRLESLLAQEQVAKQLLAYGVEPADLAVRLAGMTNAELIDFENKIDSQVAGGGALGVIGAVFVVLIILELMDVTDVFKSI